MFFIKSEKLSLKEYEYLKDISMKLIEEYHKNDIDKGGNPYIYHLLSVSNRCKSYEAKIAGLLHDIIEDTDCTEEILLERGIPQYIIDIVLIVTRKENETYNEFIDRIMLSDNIYALELKHSDIIDNCDLDRLDGCNDKIIKQAEKRILKRYIPSLKKIEEKLKYIKN